MSAPSPRISIDSSSPTPTSPRSVSAFPFPNQESAGNRYHPRRGSAGSIASIGSIGGTLDTKSRRGSAVREAGHNAISSLLQPPIVRTGLLPHTQASAAAAGFKAPTTKDIPPVTLSNIPHVPPDNFRDYLTRIAPLFESFQRGRSEADPATWLKKDKELEKTDRFADALDKKLGRDGSRSPVLSRQGSFALLSPTDSPTAPPRRRSSANIRRNRNEPTPLSTIPTVYFDEDFHLENPRTFDVVSERAEIVRPPPGTPVVEQKAANGTPLPPRKSLATNAILQEKLSWYMDTVEVHLINNISTASSGFFTALGSLKELQTEAEESVAKIQGLREDLRRLDKEVAVGGLEVAAKKRRKENVRKLGQATAQVQEVVECVKRTDDLVDEGNYEEAADQMDRTGRLICGQQEPGSERTELIDLRPLNALQGLDAGMQELQYRIGTGFAQRFTMTLLTDLRQHVEKVPKADTLKRWSRQRGINPVYMETSPELRKELLASLDGLARCGHTAPAIAGFREAATKEMKSIIRKYLPSSTDDDVDSMVSTSTRGGRQLSQQDKSSILARNLRALEHEDAEKMLVDIYTSVGEALRRLSTQTKVLLDVTSQMQSPPSESRTSLESTRSPPRSPNIASMSEKLANGAPILPPRINVQDDLSQALDMSSLLGIAVDTAQTQITRVLKVRNEQTTRLSKSQFLRYFTLNKLFADECEAVSGRGGLALRGVINSQINGFVQTLGQTETSRISDKLDADTWNAVDVAEKDQSQLDKLLAAMDKDLPEWASDTPPLWEPISSEQQTANGEATTNGHPAAAATIDKPSTPAPASKAPAKPALIDQNRYILVASATALLPILNTFLSLTSSLPSLTPQISTSLLEVLRTFNSRSSQLILGAGATRIAGLKNITTKHLALSSQALSFVIALIPYIRECVRRHLPQNQTQVLADFDKTKRLYQEHQSGIHDKLVEIMTSRSSAHVKAMLALNFDTATASPSPYMETLTKETLTLHRVLSRHLNEGEVSMIARRIFAEYKAQWTKAFGEIEVKSEKGERAMLRDAEAFDTKLSKVEEFGGVGKEVIGVVKKRVGFVEEVKTEEKKAEKKEDEKTPPAENGNAKNENGESEAEKPGDDESKE